MEEILALEEDLERAKEEASGRLADLERRLAEAEAQTREAEQAREEADRRAAEAAQQVEAASGVITGEEARAGASDWLRIGVVYWRCWRTDTEKSVRFLTRVPPSEPLNARLSSG